MLNTDVGRAALELSSAVPGVILCLLPMEDHLRWKRRALLLWGIPLLAVWAVSGGIVCGTLSGAVRLWLPLSVLGFGLLLRRIVDLPGWKSMSVLLAVCGVQAGALNMATAADALLAPESTLPGLTLEGACILCLLNWVLLGLGWYPATHAARWLLDEIEMPGTWYIFWVLPVVFVGVHLLIRPADYQNLYVGRMMLLYPSITLVLMVLMVLLYFMFYLMARQMGANMRLQRENQYLQIQSSQYESLQRSIEETRRARHDLRQHLTVIQRCMERRDWDALNSYMASYQKSIPPDTVRTYSKNYAVDAVLRHYAEKAAGMQVQMDIYVRMEESTVIPEPELCVVLGNLLENAVEACGTLTEGGLIQVNIRQSGPALLTLAVDNTCPRAPAWEGKRLRSGKRSGLGLGTESVRMIAGRYDGDARFWWSEGTFCACVTFNPRTPVQGPAAAERSTL